MKVIDDDDDDDFDDDERQKSKKNYPSVTEIRYWRFLGVPPNVTFLIPA